MHLSTPQTSRIQLQLDVGVQSLQLVYPKAVSPSFPTVTSRLMRVDLLEKTILMPIPHLSIRENLKPLDTCHGSNFQVSLHPLHPLSRLRVSSVFQTSPHDSGFPRMKIWTLMSPQITPFQAWPQHHLSRRQPKLSIYLFKARRLTFLPCHHLHRYVAIHLLIFSILIKLYPLTTSGVLTVGWNVLSVGRKKAEQSTANTWAWLSVVHTIQTWVGKRPHIRRQRACEFLPCTN